MLPELESWCHRSPARCLRLVLYTVVMFTQLTHEDPVSFLSHNECSQLFMLLFLIAAVVTGAVQRGPAEARQATASGRNFKCSLLEPNPAAH